MPERGLLHLLSAASGFLKLMRRFDDLSLRISRSTAHILLHAFKKCKRICNFTYKVLENGLADSVFARAVEPVNVVRVNHRCSYGLVSSKGLNVREWNSGHKGQSYCRMPERMSGEAAGRESVFPHSRLADFGDALR
jgi:hypothetical protein